MKYLLLIFFIFQSLVFAQIGKTDNSNFQIGIYALQAPVGTRGHQNGSLKNIKNELESVRGVINASIPYRHWDRVNYPDWDFNNYFLTYMEDMYSLTFKSDDLSCIQSFTPPMYSSFLNLPLARMPDDDRWYNRNLDFDLFQHFIKRILERELKIVSQAVSGDKKKIIEIINNPKLRPLGGWYLDDEPLVRNHDIEVIETMSEIIRLIETEFFHNKIVPLGIDDKQLGKYLHPRYIAFDGDDLHKYPKSGRRLDGKFFNSDGNTNYFKKNKIYSVFKENTFDVLLLDFYHKEISFWKKMFNDIKIEYNIANQKMPLIMPVINTQIIKGSDPKIKLDEIDDLLKLFANYNLPGIWMYIWDNFDSKNINAKVLWDRSDFNLKDKIKSIQ